MNVGDSKVLQLLIPNFNLKNILNESFIADINEKYEGNVKIVGLNIVLDQDVITLAHIIPDYEIENKIVLDTKNPEHIDLMVEIIEKYKMRDNND